MKKQMFSDTVFYFVTNDKLYFYFEGWSGQPFIVPVFGQVWLLTVCLYAASCD